MPSTELPALRRVLSAVCLTVAWQGILTLRSERLPVDPSAIFFFQLSGVCSRALWALSRGQRGEKKIPCPETWTWYKFLKYLQGTKSPITSKWLDGRAAAAAHCLANGGSVIWNISRLGSLGWESNGWQKWGTYIGSWSKNLGWSGSTKGPVPVLERWRVAPCFAIKAVKMPALSLNCLTL